MKIKILTTLLISSLIGCLSKAFAVTVRTLKETKDTADNNQTQIDGVRSVIDVISLVNSYLWFAIGFFCFIFMIRNGFKLISANGDEKAMSSAMKALVGSGVGLTICLLAYIIVNLTVKLFAS